MQPALWFVFATLLLILVPLAPKLVRLRIRFLRWLRWTWAADLLENHFDGWVLFLRIALAGIAAVFVVLGLESLGV